MARNKIEELTGYDLVNHFSGAVGEVYTYGNFLCSSYDYSEGAIEELKTVITPYLEQLYTDKWCRYILEELEIGG